MGPSVLLIPAILLRTTAQWYEPCLTNRVTSGLTVPPSEQSEQTLNHLETYRDGLRRQLHLVLANEEHSSPRSNLLLALLARCISIVGREILRMEQDSTSSSDRPFFQELVRRERLSRNPVFHQPHSEL